MTILISLLIILQIVTAWRNLTDGFCCMLAIRILVPDAARAPFGNISLNTFCTIILLAFWLLMYLRKPAVRQDAKNSITRFVIFFSITSFVIMFIPTMVPASYQVKVLTQYIVVNLIPAMLMASIIQSEHDVRRVLLVFKVSFTICIIYGLTCFFLKIPYPYTQWFIDTFGYGRNANMDKSMESMIGGIMGRIVGTPSADSYSFGMIVPVAFAIQFFIFNHLYGRWNQVLLILLGIGTLCTIRRSPILSALVFLFVFSLQLPIRQKIKLAKYALFLIASVVILVLLVPKLLVFGNIIEAVAFFWDDNVAARNDVTGSSVSLRSYQLQYTLKQLEYSWLFGNGWGAMYYREHPGMYGWESIVFTTLMQLGVWGVGLFSMMFYTMYKYSIRHLKRHGYALAFIWSSITLCILTDTIYPFFIFFGCILMGKLHLLNTHIVMIQPNYKK